MSYVLVTSIDLIRIASGAMYLVTILDTLLPKVIGWARFHRLDPSRLRKCLVCLRVVVDSTGSYLSLGLKDTIFRRYGYGFSAAA